MAEQTIEVHSSKLEFASLKKMIDIINDYNDILEELTNYFPSIVSTPAQWTTLKQKVKISLYNNLNWIGSSPGSTNSSVSQNLSFNMMNSALIKSLNLLQNQGINFNSSTDFNDGDVWFEILLKITNALNLETEYNLHKNVWDAVKGGTDTTIDKAPEQLMIYSNCELPLPDNTTYPEKANYHAIQTVLGDSIYLDYLPKWKLTDIILSDDFNLITTVTTKTIGPTGTYVHDEPVLYVLKATETSTGANLTTVSYTDAYTINITGISSGATLYIMELAATLSTATSVTPIIEQPTISSPDGGMTTYTPITFSTSSFAVSGANFDYHKESSWQIATDTGFANIVHQSLDDKFNKTSYTIDPDGILSLDTTYYWRCKHTGSTYGDSDWSDYGEFKTAEAFTCTLGAVIGGGISCGSINNYCLVCSTYSAEPSASNTYRVAADETTQLTPSVNIGDVTYRSDFDTYYINETGANTTMSDWLAIDPQEEENDEIYVASETEQLAMTGLTAGNIAIRTDLYKTYVNKTGTNTSMSDWIEMNVEVKPWWIADQYCENLTFDGYSDWYLPNASELNLINTNATVINASDTTGSLNSDVYWSSSVDVFNDKYNAWVQDISTGTQTTQDRDQKWYYCRPVRRL